MKFHSRAGAGDARGFTLSELMVSMAILMVVLAGVLSAHLFGGRLFQITRGKLGANQEARKALSLLIDEVRSAKLVKVGTGTAVSFAEPGLNQAQTGSALQVYAGTDTNSFVRYFWDAGGKQLKRMVNGAGAVSVVAHSITNSVIFAAEDYSGRVLTNNQNNRVIAMTLQFYQIQYPIIFIGPGQYFDFYQLSTRITRRALE